MDIRFVTPDLKKLDLIVTEVLAVPVSTTDRPPQGCSGLVDYRLGNKVSDTIRSGALTGQLGEKVFIRGKPRLPFDKILLYGAGNPASFNPQVYTRLVEMLLEQLSRMEVRRAVVELPGRAAGLISPEVAVQILIDRAGQNPMFDTWTLVDTVPAQKAVANLLRQDRRRQWGV